MTDQTPPLKQLPKYITKGFIYRSYKLNEKKLREIINAIVEETNKTATIRLSKHCSYLTPKQFKMLVDDLDFPPGYERVNL